MNEFILKVTCPDQQGIIAAISNMLAEFGANIIDLSQHTANDINVFMLKARFQIAGNFEQEKFETSFKPLAKSLNLEWNLQDVKKKLRVAILVSKTNHCLYELILKHQDGELNCDFPVVISNHLINEPVAKQFGIPYYHLDMKEGKAKAEARMQRILEEYKIDLVVMARYMQILTAEFCNKWENKIINIHHGFLPAFQGAKPYHQAWYKGVKIIGATAHFANEDLDQGPIITQDILHVADTCSISQFVQMGKDIERRTLFNGLKLYLDHSVFVYKNRTFIL